MSVTTSRRANPATRTRPANDRSTGLFYDRTVDRELAELERQGLARVHQGGTVAITGAGLAQLQRRRGRR